MTRWTISIDKSWRQLRPVWSRMQEHGHHTPFQHFDWISTWYEMATKYGLGTPFIVRGVYAADKKHEILIPLFLHRKFGITIISPPDFGVSDFFRPLTNCKDGFANEVFAEFFQTLMSALPQHDVLTFGRVDDKGQISIRNALPRKFIRPATVNAWHLTFDTDEIGISGKFLSKKLKKTLKRKTDKMNTNMRREVNHYWPLHDENLLERAMEMRRKNFLKTGVADILTGGPWTKFYEELLSAQNAGLNLNLTELKANEEPIAYTLGVTSGGYYVGLILTMKHGSHDRYSPGMQVAYESMQEAKRRRIHTFDLSIGDQPYKKSFGCSSRPLYTVVVPNSLKGSAAWLLWQARHRLRSFGKPF